MEILSGMILLLQVVILIQIMLVGKKVLQRIGVLDHNVNSLTERMENLQIFGRKEVVTEEKQGVPDGEEKKRIAVPVEKTQEKESQEALLNEVLSEIFS